MTHGRCQTCIGKILIRGVNDLATKRQDIAAQWHPTKNATLTPADVKPGSERPVWWRCPNGHEFEMEVPERAPFHPNTPQARHDPRPLPDLHREDPHP
ncbi:hypothetical protein CTI14_54420, partial [Methylobacterium radiotolerans]